VLTTVAWPDAAAAENAAAAAAAAAAGEKPKPPHYDMRYNERSLYMIPGTRKLALMLRGVKGGESISMCELPRPAGGIAPESTLFTCRPGVGDAFMNLVELVKGASNSSDPRVCNWTAPRLSTIPDSGSRTCAATFPAAVSATVRGIYMVGNQIDKGRDPVTLSLSEDGIQFDKHWAVRHGIKGKDIDQGGSCPRFKGEAKGCGYQVRLPPGVLFFF